MSTQERVDELLAEIRATPEYAAEMIAALESQLAASQERVRGLTSVNDKLLKSQLDMIDDLSKKIDKIALLESRQGTEGDEAFTKRLMRGLFGEPDEVDESEKIGCTVFDVLPHIAAHVASATKELREATEALCKDAEINTNTHRMRLVDRCRQLIAGDRPPDGVLRIYNRDGTHTDVKPSKPGGCHE